MCVCGFFYSVCFCIFYCCLVLFHIGTVIRTISKKVLKKERPVLGDPWKCAFIWDVSLWRFCQAGKNPVGCILWITEPANSASHSALHLLHTVPPFHLLTLTLSYLDCAVCSLYWTEWGDSLHSPCVLHHPVVGIMFTGCEDFTSQLSFFPLWQPKAYKVKN